MFIEKVVDHRHVPKSILDFMFYLAYKKSNSMRIFVAVVNNANIYRVYHRNIMKE